MNLLEDIGTLLHGHHGLEVHVGALNSIDLYTRASFESVGDPKVRMTDTGDTLPESQWLTVCLQACRVLIHRSSSV